MADISMCSGNECSLKYTCYRFTAPKSFYQSYSNRTPDENGECDAYWEAEAMINRVIRNKKQSSEEIKTKLNNERLL